MTLWNSKTGDKTSRFGSIHFLKTTPSDGQASACATQQKGRSLSRWPTPVSRSHNYHRVHSHITRNLFSKQFSLRTTKSKSKPPPNDNPLLSWFNCQRHKTQKDTNHHFLPLKVHFKEGRRWEWAHTMHWGTGRASTCRDPPLTSYRPPVPSRSHTVQLYFDYRGLFRWGR